MGKDLESKRGRSSKRTRYSSPSSDSSSRYRKDHRRKSSSGQRSRSGHRKDHRKKRRDYDSSSMSDDYSSTEEKKVLEPEEVVRSILSEFPSVASDLQQILQMIDNGQGVDLSGISDKSLANQLKKLFSSLKVEKNRTGVYMLSSKSVPTLDVIGPTLSQQIKKIENQNVNSESMIKPESPPSKSVGEQEAPLPAKRRVIGPEMPCRELLEAAAELTEAAALLNEAEIEEEGNEVLIGPPPPAMVAEAESANEAERFEEVTRLIGTDADSPYDILGINWKMSSDNIKKRYWKLSLMVHPDKCSHPHAHQAFVKLNKAFKELQDPSKRGAIDEKIQAKEEQERFEVELKAMREAAQWRRLQGISLEGDEELLAVPKEAPKRDEWMTNLPPERKPGVSMHSTTTFSRSGKEGRGDTSAWTDTPLDKAQKAKQNYLEAYNKAKALAETDDQKKYTNTNSNANLVDKYNSSKRSVSLVEKHREERRKESKKKQKQERGNGKEREKGEWEGSHPWKPWDRENDLGAGRQKVNLDPKNMAQGLTSRFNSGEMQRNFL